MQPRGIAWASLFGLAILGTGWVILASSPQSPTQGSTLPAVSESAAFGHVRRSVAIVPVSAAAGTEPVALLAADQAAPQNARMVRRLLASGEAGRAQVLAWLNTLAPAERDRLLARLSHFTPEWFARFNDPEGMRQRLLEAWSSKEPVRGRYPEAMLATLPIPGMEGRAISTSDFPAQTRTVHFSYGLPQDYRGDEVLLKVIELDQGEFWSMDRYAVDTEASRQQAWIRFDDGWPQGHYQVTLYAANETMEPLAQSEFFVDKHR